MFFVFPTHHSELTVSRLPFATISLIALNILAYLLLLGFSNTDEEALEAARERVVEYHAEHDYLELPGELVRELPPVERSLYHKKVEWLAWYAENEQEAAERVEKILEGWTEDQIAAREQAAVEDLRRYSGDGMIQADERNGAFHSIEGAFLVRVAGVDAERWDAEQDELDALSDGWRDALSSSLERRLGYVPARPSIIGLLAHPFVNVSVIQLVLSMIVLWIAGAKLEDVWTRTVLVAGYLVFGICSALVHAAFSSDSITPVLGSTGAVAGLIGAFAVRLARSRIRFVYFLWITLKPKFGTFEAPGIVVIPTWLLAELGIWAFTFGNDIGFQMWPYIGGIAAGALCATILKLSDFERKVLKKDPLDTAGDDPEDHPLVAFQGGADARPAPSPVSRPMFEVREWRVLDLDGRALHLTGPGGELMILDSEAVAAVVPARIERTGGPLANEWFTSGQPPGDNAVLVALLHEGGGERKNVSLLDASKLKYATFMTALEETPRANFFAFLRRLSDAFPKARLAVPPDLLEKQNLPVHAGLEGFLSSIQACILEFQAPQIRKG